MMVTAKFSKKEAQESIACFGLSDFVMPVLVATMGHVVRHM